MTSSQWLTGRQLKALTGVGVLSLLVVVAFINLVPPAESYEISIYDAYPTVFWVCLVLTFLVGHAVVLSSAGLKDDRSWVGGLCLSALAYLVLVLLPYVRGYRIYGRDDTLTHLGYVVDLGETGSLGGGNVYPSFHLTVRALADATGLAPAAVINLVPTVAAVVFFGAFVLLVTQLFDSRRHVLFALPFATLPILGPAHLNARPFDVAVMLTPLLLYLLVKSHRRPTPAVRAAFALVTVGFVTYHPLVTVFVLPMLVLWYLTARVGLRDRTAVATFLLVPLVVAVAWYQSFVGIVFRFRRVYRTLFGFEESRSPADTYSETLSETSPALIDLLKKVAVEFGVEGVLFSLGFATLALVLFVSRRGDPWLDSYTVLFAGFLVALGVGGLSFLFVDLIVTPRRPFQLAKIGAVVLIGIGLRVAGVALERRENGDSGGLSRGVFSVFIALFVGALVLTTVLGTVGFYPSPLGTEDNPQVTEAELRGTDWLTQNRDDEVAIQQLGIRYQRFYHAQYGTRSFEGYGTDEVTPPARFNYTEADTLGGSYATDRYLLTAESARLTYQAAFPEYREFWRYTPESYDRLERDPTVARVYAGGDLDIYVVDGTRGEGAVVASTAPAPTETE